MAAGELFIQDDLLILSLVMGLDPGLAGWFQGQE